jgi:hypothetical protein
MLSGGYFDRLSEACKPSRAREETANGRLGSGADFPALFTEFRGNRFALLRRGSREGFRAQVSRPVRRRRPLWH